MARNFRVYRRVLTCLVAATSVMSAVRGASAQPTDVTALTAADYGNEEQLAQLVWTRSPTVLDARQAAGVASSEVTRAVTLPNPVFDLGWGTVPLGRTNPSDLNNPLGNIPNYTAGIAELIELGKRGPRQAATRAELDQARDRAVAAFADQFFELLGAVGRLAKQQERAAVLDDLVAASTQLLDLDRARTSKGDLAAVDFERSEVEHLRLLTSRDAALTELETARADCAAIVAVPCLDFPSQQAAHAFLEEGAQQSLPTAWSEEYERRRPDIRALDAAVRAADERSLLAKRHAIPDVTVRLGYTYDTFEVSGNQRQSLALGMQMPLPAADRGQADLQAAAAIGQAASSARRSLTAAAHAALDTGVHRRALLGTQLAQLDQALAKARSVSNTMIGAEQHGGASLTELLLARRAYQELVLERLDLDGDAYDLTLRMRKAVALFPQPDGQEERS